MLLLSLSKAGRELRSPSFCLGARRDPTARFNFGLEADRDFSCSDNLPPLRDGKTGNDANKRLPVFL